MKITIVTGPFLPIPPAPCGAVERVWMDLAASFARRGHQVTLLSRAYPGQLPEETVEGVRIRRRMRFDRSRSVYWDILKDSWYSLRMLALLPEADILVTNCFWLPMAVPALRRRAGKVVVCVNRVPKGQMGLYGGDARLQAVSRAIADEIIRQRPDAAPRVKVIPNPINVDVFTPPGTQRRWEPGRDGRTILYTGRIHPEKGVHILVRAFEMLRRTRPDLRLKLVGPARVEDGGGGEHYLAKLRRTGASVPIELCEPIYDRAELAQTLQRAHYYCYPSVAEKGEALPVAPMEAMATGLAPVVSDIPQFRDYIEDGVTGLIFDHRQGDLSENLAAVLGRLVDDPDLAATMGTQAADRAAAFGCERVATAFLEDFESLLAGERRESLA